MDYNEKLSVKQGWIFILAIGIGLYFITSIGSWLSESSHIITQPETPFYATPVVYVENIKPETEKQYRSSCKLVSGIDDGKGIYYKDFLKNPKKYAGERLNIQAKIMSIEESDNKTVMQVYISRNFDTAIVYFDGVMKIYTNDIIRIYGEGVGIFEGQNRMGASMEVPLIRAVYIKKERTED